MDNYKVKEIVVIKSNSNFHGFIIGEPVIIKERYNSTEVEAYFCKSIINDSTWYVRVYDMKKIVWE